MSMLENNPLQKEKKRKEAKSPIFSKIKKYFEGRSPVNDEISETEATLISESLSEQPIEQDVILIDKEGTDVSTLLPLVHEGYKDETEVVILPNPTNYLSPPIQGLPKFSDNREEHPVDVITLESIPTLELPSEVDAEEIVVGSNTNEQMKQIQKPITPVFHQEDINRLKLFTKEGVLQTLEPHKVQLLSYNEEEWNEYALNHNLPDLEIIQRYFGGYASLQKFYGAGMDNSENIDKNVVENTSSLEEISPNPSNMKPIVEAEANQTPPAEKQNKESYSPQLASDTLFRKNKNLKSDEAKKRDILQLLQHHKPQLAKSSELWNEYAKQHDLPSLRTLYRYFDSFKLLRQTMDIRMEKGLEYRAREYTKESLLELLQTHKEQLRQSSSHWDTYAKEHRLPNQKTINRHFSSFSELRKLLGISVCRKTIDRDGTYFTYNQDLILELLEPHKEQIARTSGEWDKYASDHQLPYKSTIRRHFGGFNALRKALGVSFNVNDSRKEHPPMDNRRLEPVNQIEPQYTEQEPLQRNTLTTAQSITLTVLKPHKEKLVQVVGDWDIYAQQNFLPDYATISKVFGDFNILLEHLQKEK